MKVSGFVLRNQVYRDYDGIVYIFTKEYGLKKGLARSIRKVGAKLTSILTPWNKVDVDLIETDYWYIVKGALLVDNHLKPDDSPEKILILTILTEILILSLPENYVNQEVYLWFESSIKDIDSEKSNFFEILMLKLYQVLILLGYELTVDKKLVLKDSEYIFDFTNSSFSPKGDKTIKKHQFLISKKCLHELKELVANRQGESYFKKPKIEYNKYEMVKFFSLFFEWHLGREIKSMNYLLKQKIL